MTGPGQQGTGGCGGPCWSWRSSLGPGRGARRQPAERPGDAGSANRRRRGRVPGTRRSAPCSTAGRTRCCTTTRRPGWPTSTRGRRGSWPPSGPCSPAWPRSTSRPGATSWSAATTTGRTWPTPTTCPTTCRRSCCTTPSRATTRVRSRGRRR